MFCTNCGANINGNVKFCTSCGTKLAKESFAAPNPIYTPPANPVPSMPHITNEAELEETQAFYSGNVNGAAMADTFKKSVTEAELEETHDTTPAISSGGGFTPVADIPDVSSDVASLSENAPVATIEEEAKPLTTEAEGTPFTPEAAHMPNMNIGGFPGMPPVPPVNHYNPNMTQPNMTYGAPTPGYGMPNPGYAPVAPGGNVQPAYGNPSYGMPPNAHSPADESDESAVKTKRFVWHIIAKVMALITLCVAVWALICPFRGYFIQFVQLIIELDYEANLDAEFLNDANWFVQMMGAPILMVGLAGLMITEYGMASGAIMVLVLIIGYIVLFSAVINLIIYLITTFFGANKTGFASYATIASLVVSVLLIATTLNFGSDMKNVISRETHGILSEQNMEKMFDEIEEEFNVKIEDEPVAPSVAVYLLAICSVATKVTVSISKKYKKQARRF